jgi:O-antigen/teichoic acid export membrane protein
MRRFGSIFKNGAALSAMGVFGAAFFWLLSFKAVAFGMGPEGVGLFSQLRQMVQGATVIGTLGGTNAVVQGISERADPIARLQFRATASRFIAASGVSVVAITVVFAPEFAQFFLSSSAPEFVQPVRWIALAVLLNVSATYALAVLNGYRSYAFLAIAQISGPAALVALLGGVWWFGWVPNPAVLVISFVLCFGVTGLMAWWGLWRLTRFTPRANSGVLSKMHRRNFIRFALSSLIAALSSTVAMLVIRAWVIETNGLAFSGLFDAGWTLTFNYTTLLLTACSAVYLPQLASATNPGTQSASMFRAAYLVLAASTIICYCLVLFQLPLINLLYSQKFEQSGRVLDVMVIAVLFRGVSWVYGSLIVATRKSRILVVSDVFLNVCLLFTTYYALKKFGTLEALSWAFVVPNFLYLVFVIEYARRVNGLMRRRAIWPLVVAAILPLLLLASSHGGSAWLRATEGGFAFLLLGVLVCGWATMAYRKVGTCVS